MHSHDILCSTPVSFIIPAYNCAKTIQESLDSILNGNFESGDEIVITDDFSTDDSVVIIEKYVAKNPAVKLILHPQNRGGAAARNTCVRNSKHPLIFCLDSDNVLEPGSVEKLKRRLVESSSHAAAFQELRYFQFCVKEITHRWVFSPGEVFLQDCFSSHIVPPASGNYLYTKASWEAVGGYPEFAKALDAWGFGLRQLAYGCKMTVLENTGYFHRYGHKSYWVREYEPAQVSGIASKIIEPYSHLLTRESLSYIQSGDGEAIWFQNLETSPLVVKNASIRTYGTISKADDKQTKNWKKKIREFFFQFKR